MLIKNAQFRAAFVIALKNLEYGLTMEVALLIERIGIHLVEMENKDRLETVLMGQRINAHPATETESYHANYLIAQKSLEIGKMPELARLLVRISHVVQGDKVK